MRSIRCIVRTDKAAGVLRGLLPGLSTRIVHGTELDIELDTRMSWHHFMLVSCFVTRCMSEWSGLAMVFSPGYFFM